MRSLFLIATLCFLSGGSIAGSPGGTSTGPSSSGGGAHATGSGSGASSSSGSHVGGIGAHTGHATASGGEFNAKPGFSGLETIGEQHAHISAVTRGTIGGRPANIAIVKMTEPLTDKTRRRLREEGFVEEYYGRVGITYFCADPKSTLGRYVTCVGIHAKG
jgi:hypothetical protein